MKRRSARLSFFPSLAILLLAMWLLPANSHARLKVTLGNIQFKQYKIAIPDFKNEGLGNSKIAKKIANVLRNNLRLTGTFRVLDPNSYVEKAPKDGIEPNSFEWEPWNKISAEGVLKGGFREEGTGLRIKFRFYEVGTKKLALKDEFVVANRSNLRWYLHLFSEKLYKFLTNEKGIFTTKISYIRNYRGKQELWVMDFDGSNPRRITNNGSINALPAWSPNGRFIAYTSWKNRNPDLYVQKLSTGRASKISKSRGLNTGASWSKASNKIAFGASLGKQSMNIYTINPDGSGLRAITTARWGIRNLSPSWSPDGKQITFVSTRVGNPQIFVMNANGGNVRQLTTKGKYNQSPKWSPLGDWILFTGRDERNVFDIFIVSPKTLKYKRLTQNQGNNTEASWSPNGRNIVFTSTRNGVSKLFIMTAEGKNPKQISFLPGQYLTPAWSPWLSN